MIRIGALCGSQRAVRRAVNKQASRGGKTKQSVMVSREVKGSGMDIYNPTAFLVASTTAERTSLANLFRIPQSPKVKHHSNASGATPPPPKVGQRRQSTALALQTLGSKEKDRRKRCFFIQRTEERGDLRCCPARRPIAHYLQITYSPPRSPYPRFMCALAGSTIHSLFFLYFSPRPDTNSPPPSFPLLPSHPQCPLPSCARPFRSLKLSK